MRLHVILRYVSLILLLNALFLFLSAAVSLIYADSAFLPLMYSAVLSLLFGVFPAIFAPAAEDITNKEGFIIVIMSWLVSCLVGVLPYILCGGVFNFTNAWFESVSGFTTTGSSILADIEALPMGLLFWRSSTHWIGGIGIIVFALSVLPSMGRVGMILYRREMSPIALKSFRYRTREAIQILLAVYVGLTVLETFALLFCGMNLFDAVTHSFATVATGGFSPKNLSIAYYHSLKIEIVVMVFMVLSGINFALLFGLLAGNFLELLRSATVRYYLAALAVSVFLVSIFLHGGHGGNYPDWADAFRYASFQVISIGTSTGFATADSSVWHPFAVLVLIFLTLQCACAGSTSGGIKADRIVIFWQAVKKRMMLIEHPSAVVKAKIDGNPIEEDTLESGILYISLYVGLVFLAALALAMTGVDGLTSFSGSAAAMGNVGPGFGSVGSTGNFSHIPGPGKWVLSLAMLLGRLEIFGFILLFVINRWK